MLEGILAMLLTKNLATLEKLKESDAVMYLVPGDAVAGYLMSWFEIKNSSCWGKV